MRLTDTLTLMGLVLILALLLHAARHGPMKPIMRAMAIAQPSARIVVQPERARTSPRLADQPVESARSAQSAQSAQAAADARRADRASITLAARRGE